MNKNLAIVRLKGAGVRWRWAWTWIRVGFRRRQIGLRRGEGSKISRRGISLFRRQFWTRNLRDAQFPWQAIPLLRINRVLLLGLLVCLASFQTCLHKNALQLSLQLHSFFITPGIWLLVLGFGGRSFENLWRGGERKGDLRDCCLLRIRFEYCRIGTDSRDFTFCSWSERGAVENSRGSLAAAFKTRNQDALCAQSFGNFPLLNWLVTYNASWDLYFQ